MILGVGDRVRRDAEIVGRMKTLDDDTVQKDRDIFTNINIFKKFLDFQFNLSNYKYHKASLGE